MFLIAHIIIQVGIRHLKAGYSNPHVPYLQRFIVQCCKRWKQILKEKNYWEVFYDGMPIIRANQFFWFGRKHNWEQMTSIFVYVCSLFCGVSCAYYPIRDCFCRKNTAFQHNLVFLTCWKRKCSLENATWRFISLCLLLILNNARFYSFPFYAIVILIITIAHGGWYSP